MPTIRKQEREALRKRIFKVLNDDNSLTSKQISERFGISLDLAKRIRSYHRKN